MLAVGGDGAERPVDLRHLSAAYHGVDYLLNDYARRPAADQEATCLALGLAARAQYPGVAGVAVDRVLGRISVDPGDPAGPPSRRIRIHQCQLD